MTAPVTNTPLLDRIQARRPALEHDAAYCDRYRPRGHMCNQPHAAGDPHGARQPHWIDRAMAKDLTGLVAL